MVFKAADQNLLESQQNLAAIYASPDWGKQDWKEAVKWLQKAADQHYPWAEFGLNYCYANGIWGGQERSGESSVASACGRTRGWPRASPI